jgi:hypothetical protein
LLTVLLAAALQNVLTVSLLFDVHMYATHCFVLLYLGSMEPIAIAWFFFSSSRGLLLATLPTVTSTAASTVAGGDQWQPRRNSRKSVVLPLLLSSILLSCRCNSDTSPSTSPLNSDDHGHTHECRCILYSLQFFYSAFGLAIGSSLWPCQLRIFRRCMDHHV